MRFAQQALKPFVTSASTIATMKKRKAYWWYLINGLMFVLLAFSFSQWIAKLGSSQPAHKAETGDATDHDEVDVNLQAELATSLFGETPVSSEGPPSAVGDSLSRLNVVLKGVIAGKPSGMALVSVDGGAEAAFALDQEIVPGVVLAEIHADRITLKNGASLKSVALEEWDVSFDSLAATDGGTERHATIARTRLAAFNEVVVQRDHIRARVSTPHELLSQVVYAPNADGGFVLQEIQSDSLVEELGLRPGDVIRGANGQALNSIDDIRRIYQQLGNATHVHLDLVRDGRPSSLRYKIQ